ncbi:hypothetical protein ACFLYY_01665 [Patescibacteria group bacterium]
MKNIVKLIGYGVAIWVVAFMVATIFVVMNMEAGAIASVVTSAVVIITAFLFARSLNIPSVKGLLKYAISWLIVGLVLDATVTVYFTGWEFFQGWGMWLSYGLTFLAVLLGVKKTRTATAV